MFEKATALIICVACLLAFGSCSGNKSDIPEGMLKAEGAANDFYFYYDDSWELQNNGSGTDSAEIMIKPAAGTSGISANASLSVSAFSLSSDKTSYTVNDQWNEYKAELINAFPSFVYNADKDEELTLGDAPAGKKRYTVTIGEDTYSFTQIICIRYAYVYLITFTCLSNEYEARSSVINTVVNNFHFN